MQTELELTARDARDEGIKKVTDHNEEWADKAQRYIASLHNWIGTGEDLRMLITQVIGPPVHHNAWGGLIMAAVKRGLIHSTGKYEHMKTAKSHARKTPVYSTAKLPEKEATPDIKAAAKRAYEARAKNDKGFKWPNWEKQPDIVHRLYEDIARAVLERAK